MYYKKSKYRVVIMVVLAMLLQIVGPVVGDVYAAMDEGAFQVVDERLEEDIAYIDWEFTLDLDNKVDVFTYTGNFNLKDGVAVEDEDLIADDENKTVIGTYSISTKGEVTVNIDQKLYEGEKPADSKDEGNTEETREPTKTPDPVEPEGNEGDLHGTEGENGNGQEASMLEKVLTNLVYAEDDLPLVNFDIGESKVKSFKGTIEVEGAREKESLFGKLMGLFSAGKDLGNIFTGVKLIINGDVVGDGDGIVNLDEITDSMSIGLEFQWELPDNVVGGFELKKGDWAEIQLPAIFKGVTGYMNGLLLDGSRIVGTYEINDSGVLKVVFGNHDDFDEGFLNETSRKGTVGFILDFVLDPFNDNSIQEIKFGDPISKTFVIKVKPSGTLASISKSGGPNKVANADAIDWVIDVNTSLESLTNANIKDTIPEGLNLEGNIEVYNLKVGMNGGLIQGDIKETITPADERNLEVKLGQIDTAYRIKYSTKITDFSKSEYTNKAELYDGDEKKAESTVVVGKVEQGAAISKRSLKPDKNANSIKWEIDVNKGQEILNNVIVEDVLQENLIVKANSIKVYKLNLVDGSWVKGDEVTSTFTPPISNFHLSLGNLGATDVYRIEFETDIEYMDYKETNTFINKAILKADKVIDGVTVKEQVGESTASATVYRDPIIIKEGKEITSYNSEYPVVEWTIKINGANHNIYGAVLTDTIGSGLELLDSIITITDSVGNNVPLKVVEGEYPRILDKTANKMKIGFGDINSSYTIKYKTEIISIDEGTFINKAELRGTGRHGLGEGGEEVIYTVEKNVTVPPSIVNNSYSKKAVSIDYLNKTMTWQIEIDAVKEALTSLTITDTFENKYMVFIEDGFSVTKGRTTLVKGNDYTLTNKNVEGFVLEFIGAALGKEKYVITYKTSFDPNMIIEKGGTPKTGGDSIYKNKVKLTGTLKESVGDGTKDLNVDLADDLTLNEDIYNVGKKEGKLDREKKEITWRIYVNAQSRNLLGTEFKVTDTIGEGHTFKTGSLSVKEFTLKSGGILSVDDVNGITIKEDVIIPAYTVTPDTPDSSFILTFAGGIDKAYLIEYITEIKGITKPNYENKAVITDNTGKSKTYPAGVSYEDHNVFITKEALNANGGRVFADDELNWKVVVNESLSEINNAEFTDTISAGHVYVNDSLKVYKGTLDTTNLLTQYTNADADANKYKLEVTTNGDGTTTIKVGLGNIKGRYIITYDTAVISSTGVITNTAKLTGTDIGDKSTGTKKFDITKTSWGTGSGVSELRGAIKIRKVDNALPANPVKGAEFKLSYKVNNTWYEVKDEIFKTGTDGTLTIGNLPKGRTYKLVEVKAPAGYKLSENEADRTREITVVANATTEAATSIVNERIRDITVKKIWIGPGKTGNGAGATTFTLKANGIDTGKTLTLTTATGWTGKFEGLDYYDGPGNEIVYTIEETSIDGYKLLTGNPIKSTPNGLGNFTYTFNNKNMEKISIPVEKIWRKDEAKTIPASVKVTLSPIYVDNGSGYNYSLELKKTEDWKGIFTDLIKYDDEGNAINYTIKEEPALSGFATHIAMKDSSDLTQGYTVTNIELMDIPVTKKWIGTPKANTITIELWEMNGTNYGSKVSGKDINLTGDKTEDATWTGKFEKVPKYKVNGTPIQYGIKEVVPVGAGFKQYGEISGDQTTGFSVTNMELVDIKVTKKWIGPMLSGDKNKIDIQLYKKVGSAEKVAVLDKTVKINGNNTQTYTFSGLDKYDVTDGVKTEILYSVDEELTGYTDKYEKEVTGSGLDYTITNTNIEKINIPVEKVWRIENLSDRTPVEIKLKNNQNSDIKTITLNPDNNWKHTFTNLFKYDQTNGNQITYSVEEVNITGFKTQITGSQDDPNGFTVTNIELMDIPVTKKWLGTPKDNVEVTLYEDNEGTLTKIGDSKTLNESGSWKTIFTGIPKYKADGTQITYTVKETEILGYETKIVGNQTDGFTITNRQLTDIKATKVWVNGENVRPKSIKLQLYRKIGEGTSQEVGDPVELNGTESPSWTHTWKNLDATDEFGNRYTYTVDEVDVPTNYNKAITGDVVNGFIITNTYESPKKDITATKEWIEGSLIRPDIWFKLYRKISTDTDYSEVVGAEIKKLTSGTITSTWTSQDETDKDGNKYTYSVKEVNESGDPLWEPKDYVKTENGLEVKNSYNSPTDASLKAIKVWDGGPSPKPTIWFKLYRTTNINVAPEPVPTSEVADTIKELADGTTQVSWTGLKKTDVDGIPYIYSVKEVDSSGVEFVPENYKASYKHSDDKLEQTVTNTYVSPKIEITVEKLWVNGSKPEVEIELYRDGQYQESIKLNGGESIPWTYIWELDKTDKHGKDYVYTVKEVFIDNYTTVIDDSIPNKFTITNTYVIPQVEITGTKVWLGGSSTRPIIELQLYRDGVKYGEPVKLDGTETTPWAYTWEDLDKTDIDGKEYKYTVDEVNIPSYYYKSISSDGLTVTNTYSPPYYPPSPGGGGGGGSGGGQTPPEPPKPPTEESKEPEKPEEKTPTEPVGPTPDTEQPVAPTEPVTLMEQPFESVTVEKDNEGDPVIKSKDIEAPIKLVEIPTQDGVKGKITFDPETGKITADKLEPGEKVELAVTTVIDGKEIIVGKVTVTKNENGEVEVYDELIDPYGTIRDPETGEPIGGVKVQLYYADTPRNRERGLIPGTLVDLPILPGFLPNDNKNPQISTYELVFNDHPDVEDHGNYAWMVFPETDYYIVAIKEGYETFTSDIISVEWDIIKFDIDMKSSLGKPNVDVLPKTGETISYGLYLLGLIFIALGLSLRKRKTA